MDNAATSFPKPASVLEAMNHYATQLGASAGRGAYAEAMDTGAMMQQCRGRLQKLFNGEAAENFVFTFNCTDGLNQAIHGIFHPAVLGHKEDQVHAICTAIDHNSILRPLNALVDSGRVRVTVVPVNLKTGLADVEGIRKAICKQTKLIAITHASNVTGTVQPIAEIGAIARQAGVPLLVDAAQSAGHVSIDVKRDCIDLLAAPGHKGLLGPLGTGFLYIRPGIEKLVYPIKQGGTGSISENDRQPDFMPDRYEAGSHNAIGLAGLNAGLEWILNRGIEKIAAHERELIGTFLDGIDGVPTIKMFGPPGVKNRVGVFSVAVDGYDPAELSAILETSFGILTRAGLHCAPKIHETIGTIHHGGTTRFSFSPFLSSQDVSYATDALADVAMQAKVQN